MSFRKTLIAAVAAALALASSAAAHVEITPEKAARDGVVVLTLHVPAELKVATVKLEVKAPLEKVSAVNKPGWKVVVRAGIVTWSGGRIAPGKSDEFRLAGRVPKTPDKELVFPTLQTYANGTVVHWIGPPSSDEPAPRVTLHTFAAVPVTTGKNGDHNGLWLAAGIAVVVAGLALGVAAVRRRRA